MIDKLIIMSGNAKCSILYNKISDFTLGGQYTASVKDITAYGIRGKFKNHKIKVNQNISEANCSFMVTYLLI